MPRALLPPSGHTEHGQPRVKVCGVGVGSGPPGPGTTSEQQLLLHPLPSLQIAGVHSQPLPDLPHGTLDLAELERALARSRGNRYHPVCELVCLEDSHSSSGGRVLPLNYLRQVCPPRTGLPWLPTGLEVVDTEGATAGFALGFTQ